MKADLTKTSSMRGAMKNQILRFAAAAAIVAAFLSAAVPAAQASVAGPFWQ